MSAVAAGAAPTVFDFHGTIEDRILNLAKGGRGAAEKLDYDNGVDLIYFAGRKYVELPVTYTERYGAASAAAAPAAHSTCCSKCAGWFKAVGIALLILGSVAAVVAGGSVVLAAAGISILGSATYAAPVIAALGTLWSYIFGGVVAGAGVAGIIAANVSCCRASRQPGVPGQNYPAHL